MRFFLKCLLFLAFFYICLPAYSQTVNLPEVQLNWEPGYKKFALSDSKSIQTLWFEQAIFNFDAHYLPIYSTVVPLAFDGELSTFLTNTVYEPINVDVSNIKGINEFVDKDIILDSKVAFEKKQARAVLSFVPIRKNAISGAYERLISFTINLKLVPLGNNNKGGNRIYTTNSVLNQGDFYQFKVNKDGIYKIDYNFLKLLGINENVLMNNVRIYGNNTGLLPEIAGITTYDDLVENAIEAVDKNANNIFDEGDYIVFYAQSPNTWKFNSTTQKYEHQIHFYSDYAYYFLNFNIGAGKRISTYNLPAYTPSKVVTYFDDLQFYELEEKNLNHSGRRRYGEELSTINSQTFSFNIPNLITSEPVYLASAAAARSTTTPSSFLLSINGQTVQQHPNIDIVSVDFTAPFGINSFKESSIFLNSPKVDITLTFNNADPSAKGWLDYIRLVAKRQLTFDGGQMLFKNGSTVANSSISQFIFSNIANNTQIWETTYPDSIRQIPISNNSFTIATPILRNFIAFDGSAFLTPEAVGKIEKQNLHANTYYDFIIVAHPTFLPYAEQLAQIHSDIKTLIVTPQQIYNEFSSGTPDISAIRNFVKMFYDRAGNDPNLMPKNLLLFGDASFEYKESDIEKSQNYVPTFEDWGSLSTSNTYCTDDFFGFLDDSEGGNLSGSSNLLDIGIGRIPVNNTFDAQGFIDKLKAYLSTQSLGEWRTLYTLVGDDEDGNTHLEHAEQHANFIHNNYPEYNIDKIYLDAFEQQSTSGGQRYPSVTEAINNDIFKGTLVMNYVGHGGESGWSHERILTINDILKWKNKNKLPLFITATCSFSRYDEPENVSAGEHLITFNEGGAIAIVTTVRLVYASLNLTLNEAFIKRLFKPINGKMPTLGEIMRLTKNDAASTGDNNRKFILLGDPALTLAYPANKIVTTTINQNTLNQSITDTLKALQQVTISGEIRDANDKLLENFNGEIYPTVFDKMNNILTRKNDKNSDSVTFQLRKSILFKGKASVNNGKFSFSFVMPNDINYNYGVGRISYYASNTQQNIDAIGYNEQFLVGGISNTANKDSIAPKVSVFINNDKFVTGGLTDNNPILFIKLSDDSGINTTGSGVGHNITALIDGNENNIINLNQYYQAEQDNYKAGTIKYPLSNLKDGRHSIEIKAWDVFDNSGKGYTEFVVANNANIALAHVLNYPNPFTDKTWFWLEHNQTGVPLQITIQIMTITGKTIKTLQQTTTSEGNRIDNIEWNGLDEFGNKIGKGTYIYKVSITNLNNKQSTQKLEKLVLLK